jgi:hypothetical protein
MRALHVYLTLDFITLAGIMKCSPCAEQACLNKSNIGVFIDKLSAGKLYFNNAPTDFC